LIHLREPLILLIAEMKTTPSRRYFPSSCKWALLC